MSSIATALPVQAERHHKAGSAHASVRLVKLVPRLDTSVLPRRPFELKIKHTEFIAPPDAVHLFAEKAKVVALEGAVDDHVLRGHIQEQAPGTPLSTFEHGIRSRFNLDLKKLEAAAAPVLARTMNAELEQARRRAAGEVIASSRLMEQELQKHQRGPQMPAAPPDAKLNMALSRTLDSHMPSTAQTAAVSGVSPERMAAVALVRAKLPAGTGLTAARIPAITMPPRPSLAVSPQLTLPAHSSASASAEALQAELAAAKQRRPDLTAMQAQLAASDHKQQQPAPNIVQPLLDMVLTTLHKLPPAVLAQPQPATKGQSDEVDVIAWDSWHANFAALARKPILGAVSKNGGLSGSNTVEITVRSDHRLTVKVVVPSSDARFDRAITQAYESLDGNQQLAFPQGSRRDSITFLIDNKHESAGVPTDVSSQTAVGDKELIRR